MAALRMYFYLGFTTHQDYFTHSEPCQILQPIKIISLNLSHARFYSPSRLFHSFWAMPGFTAHNDYFTHSETCKFLQPIKIISLILSHARFYSPSRLFHSFWAMPGFTAHQDYFTHSESCQALQPIKIISLIPSHANQIGGAKAEDLRGFGQGKSQTDLFNWWD